MSEDKNTPELELEEANEGSELVTETQGTPAPSADGEQEEPLSIEDDQKPSRREQYAQIQEEVWTDRIAKETDLAKRQELIEQLEQNPSTRWLSPKVKENLGLTEEAPKSESDLVQEAIARREFESNKKSLYDMPTKVRNDAVREYQELKALGADPYKALEKVLAKARDSLKGADANKDVARNHMQIPRHGRSVSDKTTYSTEELAKLDQSEYNRIRDLEDQGLVTIVG